MHAGGFTYADGEDDISKEKYLRIYLKNVGEDLILNLEILLWKINGEKVEASCSNKVVYKNEEIIF